MDSEEFIKKISKKIGKDAAIKLVRDIKFKTTQNLFEEKCRVTPEDVKLEMHRKFKSFLEENNRNK